MTTSSPLARPRKPSAAVLLSLVTPGLGHLYAGKPRLALAALLLTQVAGLFPITLVLALASFGTVAIVLPIVVSLATLSILLVHAYRTARRAAQNYELQPFNRWWVYIAVATVFLVLWQPVYLALIKQHLLQAYQVRSPSMEPTLLQGDFVFVSKLHSGQLPSRDQCVILELSGRSITVVKRVAGESGDTLAMRKGRLIRNGREISEPWAQLRDTSGSSPIIQDGLAWHYAHLITDTTGYRPTMRDWGPVVIPRDSVFVLGDNRDESYDSRFYGAVPLSQVRGYPILVYLSLAPMGGAGPWIRWRRIGTRPWVAA